jgi:hypothetical protein
MDDVATRDVSIGVARVCCQRAGLRISDQGCTFDNRFERLLRALASRLVIN